jgi:aspartate/methionine/tyrosine aminotransferase
MIFKKMSERIEQVSSFHVMEVMARAKSLESLGREIVHMEVGEPDFPTPQPIIDAGIKFLEAGDVRYTKAQGLPALREKIAEYYQSQYDVSITADRVFITPGASGALTVALASLLDVGDEVLVADPGYPCNSNLVTLFGGTTKFVEAPADSNFQLNAASIKESWGETTRGAMIASPSNPTGTMLAANELKFLVKAVQEKNGFLISDEIYHGLVYEDRAVSALEFSDDVFILNSFSKYFGMTGWRLGWLIVPEYATSAANRLMQNLYISAPTHSQHAALAAFDGLTQTIIEERRIEFKRRRDVLYDGLKALGFGLQQKPQGAFYIYADCSAFTRDSQQFALDLLEQAGVAITPGIDFGCNRPERYVRFAYTTSLESINKGLKRLKSFLDAK